MFRPAFLLRFLLALALAVNGVGNAIAAVHMLPPANDASTVAHTALAADAGGSPPCHEAAGSAHPDPGAAASGDTESTTHGKGCCAQGSCQCNCMHGHGVAMVTRLDPTTVEPAQVACGVRSAHATPALPHLIRPPIG